MNLSLSKAFAWPIAALILVSCSQKAEEESDSTKPPQTPPALTFLQKAAANLSAELSSAGFSNAQIEILTSTGENAASSLSAAFVKKVRTLTGTAAALVDGQNFLVAVENELDNSQAGFSASEKAQIMGLLLKVVIDTYKTEAPTIGDASGMNDLVENLLGSAIENLGDIGLSASEIADAAQNIVKAAVANLDELADDALIPELITKVVTVSLGAIENINGVQASHFTTLAKNISQGATSAIASAGITSAAGISEVVKAMNSGLVTGIEQLGVSVTDANFQTLIAGIVEGTVAGINSLGITTSTDVETIAHAATLGVLLACNSVPGFDNSRLAAVETSIQTGASSGFGQLTNLAPNIRSDLTDAFETYIEDADYANEDDYEEPPASADDDSDEDTSSPPPDDGDDDTTNPPPADNSTDIASIELSVSAPGADNATEIFDFGSNIIDVPVGFCTPMVITLKDSNAANLIMNQNVTVQLTDTSSHANFFSNSSCTTAITSATVAVTTATTTVYAMSTTAATVYLEASANSVTSTVDYSIHPGPPVSMTFAPGYDWISAITCPTAGENAVRIDLVDAYGNSTFARDNITFTFVANDTTNTGTIDTFACTSSTSFTIPQFQASVFARTKATTAGTYSFTASATGLTTQIFTTTFIPPTAAYLYSIDPTYTATVNECKAISFRTVNYQFQNENVTADLNVALSDDSAGQFFTDSSCMNAITSTVVTTGTSQKQIYYKNAQTGTHTINIDSTELLSVTLGITVSP